MLNNLISVGERAEITAVTSTFIKDNYTVIKIVDSGELEIQMPIEQAKELIAVLIQSLEGK